MIHDLHLHQTLSIHTHFTPQSSPRLDSPRTYCTTEACPVLAIHDFRPILISSWIVLCSHPGPGFHHPPPPSIPCQVTRPENSGGRPLNKTSCVCCSVLSCSLLTLLSCACTCTCTPSPRWDCLKIKPPPIINHHDTQPTQIATWARNTEVAIGTKCFGYEVQFKQDKTRLALLAGNWA